MKILMAHNFYQTGSPSGENSVYQSEVELLRKKGHIVITFERHNDRLAGRTFLSLAWQNGPSTVWSSQTYRELRNLLKREKPEIAHFHNTFPQISPSAYYACLDENVPVVQTLHNFRLFCANALLFRNGRICEDCLKYGPIMGLVHGCYRNSRIYSLPVVASEYIHSFLHTYQKAVSKFIALTNFARDKFIAGGIKAGKITVKSNFVDIPQGQNQAGNYAIFIGRLDEMKGIEILVKAARFLPEVSWQVVGDGPLKQTMVKTATKNVSFHGLQPFSRTIDLLAHSRLLVMPSEWFETFGRTIVEAFACGKPVVASRLGAMAEIVEHGWTGLLFSPGDAEALAAAVKQLMEDKSQAEEMGQNARKTYEKLYTPDKNYEQLMEIYQQAITR